MVNRSALNFNTVNQAAEWAKDFGLITVAPTGYQFKSIDKIIKEYNLFFHSGAPEFNILTIDPENKSLEHILKTFVFGENFARQRVCSNAESKKNSWCKRKTE